MYKRVMLGNINLDKKYKQIINTIKLIIEVLI